MNQFPKDILTRQVSHETNVIDAKLGIVEYVASDESLDAHRTIVKASGWRFDERFDANPVFLNSHRKGSIGDQLGKVIKREVRGTQLIEQVQWAIDVEENYLARFGFRMTEKGYSKAVSVSWITKQVVFSGEKGFSRIADSIVDLSDDDRDQCQAIFTEQQQTELSACVLGSNPSALKRAFEDREISEEMMFQVGFKGAAQYELLDKVSALCDNPDLGAESKRVLGNVFASLISTSNAFSSEGRGADEFLQNPPKSKNQNQTPQRSNFYKSLEILLAD